MIPKIIHYCWFGKNPEPPEVRKCIRSWKKFLPDYKIIRWDESNYDIHKNQYMSDAYKETKWAFVSDYCRLDVVYNYGGIYLDTDVEVIKKFDSLLNESMFCGFESRDPIYKRYSTNNSEIEYSVNFGLGYGAEKGHHILKEMLELYESLSFYKEDGSLNLVACPRYQTMILKNHGLIPNNKTQRLSNFIAYSPEYFCPQSNITDEMLFLTENTYSIHHFTVSWASKKSLKLRDWKNKLRKFMPYWMASKIVTAISKIILYDK